MACPEAASCKAVDFADIRQIWPLSKAVSTMLIAGKLSGPACELIGSPAYLYNDQVCACADTVAPFIAVVAALAILADPESQVHLG